MLKSRFKGRSLASGIADVMQNGSCEFKDLISACGLDAENGEVSDIDLSGIDLSNQDLSQLDLAEASFKEASLNQTNLHGAKFDPIEIQLSEDYKTANLEHQDLNEVEAARYRFILSIPVSELKLSRDAVSYLNYKEALVVGELVRLSEPEVSWYLSSYETDLKRLLEFVKAMGLAFEMQLRPAFQNLYQHPKNTSFNVDAYVIERFGDDFLNKSYLVQNLYEVREYKRMRDVKEVSRRANLSVDMLLEYEKKRKTIGISGMQLFNFIKVLGRYTNLLEVTVK